MRPQAVYIDWPFFYLQKFPSYKKRYARALCMEMSRGLIGEKHAPAVLYVGGGGVNFMSKQVGLDISDKLRELYSFDGLQEGTIEVAHGLLEMKHLAVWQRIGINRVVIRIDTIKQLKMSMDYLQKISYILALDCSITLTQETIIHWQQFLKNCAAWPFKQISISLLRGSCQKMVDDFYHWLQEHYMTLGMNQYELYSFAYHGYESRYMQALWNHEIVKGFGAGAESYDGTNRVQNICSVKNYIHRIECQQLPTRSSYHLTAQYKRLEQLLMGLRMKDGICHQMLYEGLNEQQRISLDLHITQLERHKLVIQQNGRIILAPDGRGYEDTIVLQLIVY